MTAARRAIAPGVSELDVYAEMVYAMAKAGGESPGIVQPVVSGAKNVCGHGLASRRTIMPGDIVNVDICGVYHRYHANLARPFSVGEPHPEISAWISKVTGAIQVVAETIRPGLLARDLLATMEKYYRDSGIWEDRWWVGGYELGIAFPPDWVGEFQYECFADPGDATFLAGDVVNYESDFYLPRMAGMALVINTIEFIDDAAEFLTSLPAELIVVE